jgi:hypothetical protein
MVFPKPMPVRQTVLTLFLLAAVPLSIRAASQTGESSPKKTYSIQEFDSACGKPGHNCQRAFQFAFRTLARTGGGTLQLPPGRFSIYFPGVPENVPGGVSLPPQSLIVVPPNTMIEGHLAANGTSDSVIEWRNTSVPVFIFARASHSGMRNLHLEFTGLMSKAYPFGDIALLNALGYHPTFPHLNQMSGNNGEMFSFAYVFDSDYCTFDHLLFDSAIHDNAHTFSMAINLKGKGVVETGGGGLTQLADSNRVTNIQVYDFYNGFLVAGQNRFFMQNITANRRGSTPNAAPGHVLYTTSTLQYDMAAHLVQSFLSTNTTVQNITEGPDTYSNASSGGTLAIKFLNGAQISHIISQHPEGLIQTIYADQNVIFKDMHWTSHYPLCTEVPANCSTPAIYSAASPSNLPPTKNLTFENISLVSTASPTTVVLIGDNLRVNGLQITTPADFLPGQKATNAVLSVKNTNGAVIKGYVFTPVIDKYDPEKRYNSPFTGWNPSKNVSAEITINWPKGVSMPEKSTILAGGYQDKSPGSNNTLQSSILKR